MGGIPEQFRKIEPVDIERNVFRLIADDWFLLTAGELDKNFNTMTASWGGLGELWHRKVAFVFVRPQRFTMSFMESNDLFTMSFFGEEYRETLKYCGTNSGENVNKIDQTGLTPFKPIEGTVSFKEAKLVLVCRKLYSQDLDHTRFLDPGIEGLYPEKGYHRLFVGEITEVLKKGKQDTEKEEELDQ